MPSEMGTHQITIKLGYITINGSPFTTEVLDKRIKKENSRYKHRSEMPRPRLQSPSNPDNTPATPNGSSEATETPRTAELNLSPTALLRQMPKFTSKKDAANGSAKRVKVCHVI